jgi:drug/metabolite transporter (DMT)-like permease
MSVSAPLDGATSWRLVTLAMLWGGAYFLVQIGLRELPPLTIVWARTTLGAIALLPILLWLGLRLPQRARDWLPLAEMGMLNNVVPMSMIVFGMTTVSSGLASVLNATTPFFTTLVLAAAGDEPLTARRLSGVMCGVAGVAVLQAPAMVHPTATSIGVLLCLGAAFSYGLAGLWARRQLTGVPVLVAATGQLMVSGAVMAAVALSIEQPWTLPTPGIATWLAMLGLGVLSTAIAYILFFQIVALSGASNVMLVTLLIPLPAIFLGCSVLGESLELHQMAGAAIIAAALVIIDGRLGSFLCARWRRLASCNADQR